MTIATKARARRRRRTFGPARPKSGYRIVVVGIDPDCTQPNSTPCPLRAGAVQRYPICAEELAWRPVLREPDETNQRAVTPLRIAALSMSPTWRCASEAAP